MNIKETVLEQIKPTQNEKKEVNEIIKEIKERTKEEIIVGGSVGKDTNLKGKSDIDLFFKFNKTEENISEKLRVILKKYNPEKIKASRDYYKIKIKNYEIEAIAVYNIKKVSEAENIMDLSPMHVTYIKNKLKNKNELRIFKKFLQSNHVYGSETHKKGLSGYASELLLVKYKTFEKAINEISNWKEREIIDLEKQYKNKNEILKQINKEKITKLIIIDPTNKERNAAASLSDDNYKKLKKLAKNYKKNPSIKWFEEKEEEFKLKENEQILTHIIKIKSHKEWGMADKKLRQITKQLELQEIPVKKFWLEEKEKEAKLYFITPVELNKKMKKNGPEIKDEENIKKFKQKWKNRILKEWIENKHLIIEIKRPETNVKKIFHKILRN